jgi:hypothetical protein
MFFELCFLIHFVNFISLKSYISIVLGLLIPPLVFLLSKVRELEK